MSIMSSRANRLREREQRKRCRETVMSEEEMMDVALRLSEEEARVSMNRMQQEEAMRRSLHDTSCDPSQMEDAVACPSPVFPSSSCRAAEVRLGQLDQDLLQTCRTLGFVHWSQDTQRSLQKPLSQGPSCSGGRSPVFGRSSQHDGTSQNSHILPEHPDPVSHALSGPMKANDSLLAGNAAFKSKPGFPEVDDGLVGRLFSGPDNNAVGWLDSRLGTSDTILMGTDEDMTLHCPRSPVFPREHRPCTSSRVEELRGEGDLQNIHYYWGIPFCPGGLDPDVYSQVILTQFEVQEKCLKRAQRRLLNKAPWGGPILPQQEKCLSPEQQAGSPQLSASRGCCVSRRLQMRRQWSVVEEENGDGKNREEEEGRGETQVERDWEACPETQLSDSQSVHELKVFTEDGLEPAATSPELHIVREDSASTEEEQQEEEEQRGKDTFIFK